MKQYSTFSLIITLIVLVVILSVAFVFLSPYGTPSPVAPIDESPVASSTPEVVTNQPQRITVEGTLECLPHRNTSGPQTLECAFGIAVDQSDSHYALNTSLMSAIIDFPTGAHVRLHGVLIPRNPDNTRMWDIYDIDGIIGVTSMENLDTATSTPQLE